jgi:membrane-associated phospholipid phosphatase
VSSLRLVDRVALFYTGAVTALLVFAGSAVDDRFARVGAHLFVIGATLLAVTQGRRGGLWQLPRALYPLPLLLFWWAQLEAQIPLLWGNYWTTSWIVAADFALFGGYPTTQVQAWFVPWLDELMAFSYLSYYLFLAVPVVLVVRRQFDRAVAGYGAILLTYAVNFGLFIALPTKSPPQIRDEYPAMIASPFEGFVLTDVIRSLQANESVTGAAFPSSHIAGSMVCTLVALRYVPALGRILVPLLAGMSVATVYLGYHHALDPLAGLVLGWACFALAARFEPDLSRPAATAAPEAAGHG